MSVRQTQKSTVVQGKACVVAVEGPMLSRSEEVVIEEQGTV